MVGREGIRTFTKLMAVLQTVELTHAQPTQGNLFIRNLEKEIGIYQWDKLYKLQKQ